ncbi:CDP-alcohol phosphatidyltransferase family protein [Pacificibacter marinus]|uniref:Phosphatidylcholine synthase n=1 Tax=Pacificibacter marinus TaxID=658057 RepID=A0A1Y5RGI9_9RHOB|nr:CDP-alcohol phosphatidyltransferase family protein [Pacificibacter marinus]SEK20096.1 phosphatidylcholine synthase [Pacificibacter marinus]SLN16883.1 Phosphatidylcholine synthase [Pacificibacter marinus]
MNARHILANSIHVLTAIGAALALLALFSAAQGAWNHMFLWLLAALVVDGIDGPLARKVDTKTNAPRIDGVLLDLVVDFLTYVFVPIFALVQSGMVPGWTGWVCALSITTVSALYFADTRMKTEDASFEGFPGCWNMVALVFFALEPPVWAMVTVMVILTPAMFLPIRFVHPVRTVRWRYITLPVTLAWIVFSTLLMAGTYTHTVATGLIIASLYLLGVGAVQQIVPPRRTKT